jgi:hypothetical protein
MKEKHACKNDTPERDNHRFVQSSSSNVQKLKVEELARQHWRNSRKIWSEWESGLDQPRKKIRFKFENGWLQQDKFQDVVQRVWNQPLKGESAIEKW